MSLTQRLQKFIGIGGEGEQMKIIHCADLHLDSKLSANLDKNKAKERRNELLSTFIRMTEFAEENGVKAVLIAGDMFDTAVVSLAARRAVYDVIKTRRNIDFYYLRGNHDASGFFNYFDEIPDNLMVFGEEWSYYEYSADGGRKIVIAGVEQERTEGDIYSTLSLSHENFNIVILHGELTEYKKEGSAESIEIKKLYDRNIDYLALGHIHEYREGKLSPRGEYRYPGCLEGRGFDELGERGFVLLEINEGNFRNEISFIPFAKRRLYEVEVDVTGTVSAYEMLERAKEEVKKKASSEDLVRIILTGEIDIDCDKNTGLIKTRLSDEFYFIDVKDKTSFRADYRKYLNDATLKGEFVRLVQAEEPIDDIKAEIIRTGLFALNGEEIGV